ncbi:hypothetical protein K470DRAFT_289401 [Piedraia hortae CBS 480.64]|uniref:Uncharacterized protein n=1 Tax=Piedraia hortae CBS 480.64 TaxID=1314780 RepID=A0A6A7BTD5_9PEZI|nr:hypothetical protein K470DRAFT_289401 [Piedraia hortae CBS 480.64]
MGPIWFPRDILKNSRELAGVDWEYGKVRIISQSCGGSLGIQAGEDALIISLTILLIFSQLLQPEKTDLNDVCIGGLPWRAVIINEEHHGLPPEQANFINALIGVLTRWATKAIDVGNKPFKALDRGGQRFVAIHCYECSGYLAGSDQNDRGHAHL